MAEENPYLPWPGVDDKVVVEEMQRDTTSARWNECYEFVSKLVQLRAKNIPQDQWDDIIQDAMLRTRHSLPTFQFQCKLKNWIYSIVGTAIIDAHRRHKRVEKHTNSLDERQEDVEHDSDIHPLLASSTVEDQCIINDELAEALVRLRKYLSAHAHTQRNGRIADLVLFEGNSLEEAAKAVGCSAPVAGYVIRSMQRYLREMRERDL
jgi:RNA polymerase sigma factor (sigma-70 family)